TIATSVNISNGDSRARLPTENADLLNGTSIGRKSLVKIMPSVASMTSVMPSAAMIALAGDRSEIQRITPDSTISPMTAPDAIAGTRPSQYELVTLVTEYAM